MSAPGRSTSTPFSEHREALLADESLQGPEFTRAYAGLVDNWLTDLLADEPGVALVAVGGYGRGELSPASDLDLMLLHRGRRDVGAVAQRLWYPIWDAGLSLDHSVRTPKEALAVADGDLKAAMGLLDARWVAGDVELASDLVDRAQAQWRGRARRWMTALGDAVTERHARMGDVAFLVEPDLKEAKGGLRDVYALRAAMKAVPVVPADDLAVLESADILVAARVALHRHTGRLGDRLGLQDQEAVAGALGFDDADDLMRAISAAARTIGWGSDDAWRRIDAWLAGPKGRTAGHDRPLGRGIVLRDGEVDLDHTAAPANDTTLLLRVAAAAATSRAPIARPTLRRFEADASPLGDPWTEEARDALLELLGAGDAAIPVFEALDQHGLLTRILPEWEPVRSKLQHNPYHRFTVDRHLLEAAARAAPLAERVSRPDILLVAAWLHDLGKGYPGDHTEAGIELMARIGPRLGFSPEDVAVLVDLVRHHLLLVDAATRRDLRDPATVTRVVAAVGSPLTLELLDALTEADARATGETAWTPWKESLVRELVQRVQSVLEGEKPGTSADVPAIEYQEALARAAGELLVEAAGSKLVVVAPDRPGLFCQIAGVLTLNGLDVLAADAWSAQGGMALDVFQVNRPIGGAPDWGRFERDLEQALDGRLALESRVAERARTYGLSGRTATRRPVRAAVTVDNEASDRASVVEVRAPDALGTLYRITRALADLQLDIRHAKVLTLGAEVVDSFYVVDRAGAKVSEEGYISELERAVLFELSRLDEGEGS